MLFTIKNRHGAEAIFSNIGARIVSLKVPNKDGVLLDVVQGYDTEEEYFEKGKSQGVICGRYANRIANAEFELEGKKYYLQKNNGDHCLHGGDTYIRMVEYKGESFGKQAHFVYESSHLEGGFPGNVKIEITYTLDDENDLKIQMVATTDQPTHLNLTSHPYFNLKGEGMGNILDHQLKIDSKAFLEIDETGIPTDTFIDVPNTAFDFRDFAVIAEKMAIGHPQVDLVNGYDHCFVISEHKIGQLKLNAQVKSEKSGIVMSVHSTYPGIQLYTANKHDSIGKLGHHYGDYSAICLEPQFYPDSPNHPEFPSTLLLPNQKYQHMIIYQFTIHE